MNALRYFIRPGSLTIFTVSVLHIVWGCMLLDGPLQTVGLSLISKTCGSNFSAGIVLMGSGILAMVSVIKCLRRPCFNIIMFFPQQMILGISAASSIACSIEGKYADGVIHSSRFIFSDQLWCITLFVSHAAAIIMSHSWIRSITFVSIR